jgi:NAD(P)-dependent dehydrogenase (short-subunit alcohol dehydrogenase family)
MSSRVVRITGALTGIGRATAVAFAREGARVVVFGRHDDEGRKLATELRNLGTEAEFVRTDVRHEEEVKNLVDRIIARFGRLDIAVNNAGTVGTLGPAADVNPESYQAIFDTNVLGVVLCMKYEIRAMLREGKGSIVNISSFYGKVGGPTAECMSAASTLWKASRSLRPSNSPAQAFVSTSLALVRRKQGSSTALRKRRKTKQISSRHTFLPGAWERPKRLQMPWCSLGLTRPLTSSVHPWRGMEGCSRGDSSSVSR